MSVSLITSSGIVSGRRESADAVLIRDGRIDAIGPASDLRSAGIKVTGHLGGFLSPVLQDHHFHPVGYAAAVTRLSLKDVGDLEDLKNRLQLAARRLAPGEALVGNRLDDEVLAEKRLPTRGELDVMVRDRPVLLYRYCGHVATVNTAALVLAGVESSTGILRETDIQPVANAIASAQAPLEPAAIRRVLDGLVGLGLGRLTAIVSAGDPIWCETPDEIGTLLTVAPHVPINFEVLVIASSPSELGEAAARLDRAGPNISFLGWKEFADGSLGGRTAALYEPYSDDPGNRGILRLDHDHARTMARAALGLGGAVAIHAIGDLANDQVLDLFEDLITDGADPTKLRVEHASVLTERAIERMARLGVTASVQPAFLSSEVGWLDKRLGRRTELTYPLARLSAVGVPLLGGSDCPVEAPNPWWGMASAQDHGGLSQQAAFDLFAARLEVGGPADLLVLPFDPFGATPAQLRNLKPNAVYRHGELVELNDELPFT
jgi:predicted amidohydrolase YtcJ